MEVVKIQQERQGGMNRDEGGRHWLSYLCDNSPLSVVTSGGKQKSEKGVAAAESH